MCIYMCMFTRRRPPPTSSPCDQMIADQAIRDAAARVNPLYMFIYLLIYVYIYIYVFVYIYMCVCVYAYTYASVCVYIYTC